jgi:hypothetical protein
VGIFRPSGRCACGFAKVSIHVEDCVLREVRYSIPAFRFLRHQYEKRSESLLVPCAVECGPLVLLRRLSICTELESQMEAIFVRRMRVQRVCDKKIVRRAC